MRSATGWSVLQPANMQAAVHVNRFTRAERQKALSDGSHCLADILRRAPAPDRAQPFTDKFVIFVLYRRGHVRSDNSRPDLINIDAVFRQPDREKRCEHGEGGLGN